MTEEGHRRSYV